MSYHHLALAAKDMKATHHFYENILEFELVKVEVAPIPGGGWGKHFFYRMDGDDSKFIAFWELHDVPGQENHIYDLNKGANLPGGTNHYSFSVDSREALDDWLRKWTEAGLDVLEIDHNWCHSIYTNDPNGNMVEFCLTTGTFTAEDRAQALAMMDETEFKPSPAPAKIEGHQAKTGD
ncbi:MAG: VOC family protein [Halioglobus sp.]|nr:VOC family protein [Halioglobus sp.]